MYVPFEIFIQVAWMFVYGFVQTLNSIYMYIIIYTEQKKNLSLCLGAVAVLKN